jgi:hypothetical protein
LATTLCVPDQAQPWALRHHGPQLVLGRVAGSVVHKDRFESAAVEGRFDLGNERSDVSGFIARRHDHGNRGPAIARVTLNHAGRCKNLASEPHTQKVPKLGGRYKLAAVAAIMSDRFRVAAVSS